MLNRANSEPVEPVVVVLRVDTSRVEVQVPRITGGVERSRPVVAVRAAIVPRLPIAVARASKKELSGTSLHENTKEPRWSQRESFVFPYDRSRKDGCPVNIVLNRHPILKSKH